MNWNEKYIALAQHYATWSKDPSTKVGCVLVDPESMAEIAQGYNGFPRKVRELEELATKHMGLLHPPVRVGSLDPERWSRPTKYMYIEHAERNAIYNAARLGHPTNGSWAYLSWDPRESVCTDCARALIQAGIRRVIGPKLSVQGRLDILHSDGDWRSGCGIAREMLKEARVMVIAV